jgi:hypothetical protein
MNKIIAVCKANEKQNTEWIQVNKLNIIIYNFQLNFNRV